ncbi:MAG: AraC family transcriptional regulator [Pseudomonadota bacterium]
MNEAEMKDLVEALPETSQSAVFAAETPQALVEDFGGEVISPPDYEIATGRFKIGSHSSKIDASQNCMLVLACESCGELHWNVGGERGHTTTRSNMMSFVPAGIDQTFEFRGRTNNTVLSIRSSLFDRVGEIDPELGGADRLDPRMLWFNSRLRRLVLEQERMVEGGEVGWRVHAEALALRICYEILASFGQAMRKPRAGTRLAPEEIDRITDFVEEEIDRNFDLSEMAEVLDRDPIGFSSDFEAATGQTPHQFVVDRRLSRAKELLRLSSCHLADIAASAGFSSHSHMTDVFSSAFGIEPGCYRRIARS